MKSLLLICFSFCFLAAFSQQESGGVLSGNILDEKSKPLEGATIQLILLNDSAKRKSSFSDSEGSFSFANVGFGFYRLSISHVNHAPLTIDSIYFREERSDFNLSDIMLKSKLSENLNEVVVYAEKPLVQSKDGNITFNAGESALSAGSNASDLLSNVPLVTKDPDGKILVRGKEPKILIDDKPVELNQQQLQDLLESMPGSAIEKIEVLTNPPPQFANEPGGVINITTKKGKVGKSGRITFTTGSRGEASANGSYSFRKQGLSYNINAGLGFNRFNSNGYAIRENFNNSGNKFFTTENNSRNQNLRPNFRASVDYDFNKRNSINFTAQLNQNHFNNRSQTMFLPAYQMSRRQVTSAGENFHSNINITYTHRTKRPGEVFRLITSVNVSQNENDRVFNQEFLNADYSFNGRDSLQQQFYDNSTYSYNTRANYDLPLSNKKSFLSFGGFRNTSFSHIRTDAFFRRFADKQILPLTPLINAFKFNQDITNLRASFRQVWSKQFSLTGGVAVENTSFTFNVYRKEVKRSNDYWTILPFTTISRSWNETITATASYKRVIRRPGINELTPIVDSSDLFNLRTGNPELKPSLTDNFDLVLGKTKKGFFSNLGIGYHKVADVFNQLRTRVNDSTTLIQWQNSSSKEEVSISSWNGITISKKSKINFSASYTYNMFSGYDKETRGFKNGGSLTSNLNTSYLFSDIRNITASFTYNRFANPQGTARSNLSTNIGFQAKMLDKKLILTMNIIDPLRQQQNRTFTYGKNFTIENFSATRTRNFRLTAAYNFTNAPKKKSLSEKDKQKLLKPLEKAKSK